MSSIDVSQVVAFGQKLDGFDRILDSESRRTMQQSLDVAEAQISARTPVNTGALRAGNATEIRGRGLNVTGMVYNPLLYAWPVEEGRKAGKMPPVNAIKLWVIRKGIASRGNADGVAFMIARAIGRRGTKGAFMFKKGFEAAKPTIINLWKSLPDRVLRRLTG